MSTGAFLGALTQTERTFVHARQKLGFGRYEGVRIAGGKLVLDPWPTTVQGIKFRASTDVEPVVPAGDFVLKRQVVELFEYVRGVEAGEIRCLEIRHGLPFTMEIERGPAWNGGRDE